MNLAPFFLIPIAVYVAILNACNNPYSRLKDADHYGWDPCDIRNDHVRLRTIGEDVKGRFTITKEELQQEILTLWDKDKTGRADGLYTTDWQHRKENNIAINARINGLFFRDADHDALMANEERKLLWDLFEAYDTVNQYEKINNATDDFFRKAMDGDPFQYVLVKQYLNEKGHPNAANPDEFDATVKRIWTTDFVRARVNARSTAVRHYFNCELKTYSNKTSKKTEFVRIGLHHWWRLYYLEWNGRLFFHEYPADYAQDEDGRILNIRYGTRETIIKRNSDPKEEIIQSIGASSTIFGTTPGFDIALMTLLYFTIGECETVPFFLGDGTTFEVLVKSIEDRFKKKTKVVEKFMGSMYARPRPQDIREGTSNGRSWHV